MASLAVTVTYLGWRIASTLNPEARWLSLAFLGVELYGAIGFGLFVFSLWDTDHVPRPRPRQTTEHHVAVLIPTFDEPPEVLLPTVASSVELSPAHETWVLDDGDRPWVKEMADQLGAHYLARSDHSHAKAGNLNHALDQIDADLLAVLDADHVPQPGFLTNTIAYFDDANVALVQTPQDFYNRDSFEHRGAYCEEELFYRAIQPGKNRWNAAFWCGTSAVLRRQALIGVGGVATESLTEDIHTTIRLHRAGWRTVFHDEVLARGLAARSFAEYHGQRFRWGTGAMQVLRSEHPIVGRGLTPEQRISYLFTLNGWFESWRTLAYLLIPMVVLFTGQIPIRASLHTWLIISGLVLATQQLTMVLLGRGWTRWYPALLFDILRMPAALAATLRLLIPGHGRFEVTAKGGEGDHREIGQVPRLLWLIVASGAGAWAWAGASLLGLTPTTYASRSAVLVALGFLILQMVIVVLAIARILEPAFASERRSSVRMGIELDATVDDQPATVHGLSLNGGRVIPAQRLLRTASEVDLVIALDPPVAVRAQIVHQDRRAVPPEWAFVILAGQWRERAKIARALLVLGYRPSRSRHETAVARPQNSVDAPGNANRWSKADPDPTR